MRSSMLAAALLAMTAPLRAAVNTAGDVYHQTYSHIRGTYQTSATGIRLSAGRRGPGTTMAQQKRAATKKRNRARHKARC